MIFFLLLKNGLRKIQLVMLFMKVAFLFTWLDFLSIENCFQEGVGWVGIEFDTDLGCHFVREIE